MADGSELYTFSRFGSWRLADILGLSEVISKNNLNELEQKQGVMIAYTHLGKPNPDHIAKNHIPEVTKKALKDVKTRFYNGRINFSSLSNLLDYFVLKNNISINGHKIFFNSDGLRFAPLTRADLVNHQFSFTDVKDSSKIEVFLGNEPVSFSVTAHENNILTLSFNH